MKFPLALLILLRHVRNIMGDKSPKATNKQAAQKKAKANVNASNKSSANAAKQAAKGKK